MARWTAEDPKDSWQAKLDGRIVCPEFNDASSEAELQLDGAITAGTNEDAYLVSIFDYNENRCGSGWNYKHDSVQEENVWLDGLLENSSLRYYSIGIQENAFKIDFLYGCCTWN